MSLPVTLTRQRTVSAGEVRYPRPGLFFLLATVIPWALWIPAAWASRQGPDGAVLVSVLGIAGLFAPLGVVGWMSRGEPELRRDMLHRLGLGQVRPIWVLIACGLMPAGILVATAISLAFGYSPDQFLLRGGVTFAVGLIPGWVVLVLAPVVEELAWHSYGTDALRTRFTVFTTSMVFAVIWACGTSRSLSSADPRRATPLSRGGCTRSTSRSA
ncbi:MAG: hypothetical protein WA892_02585 [Ornithinimicrobium sp.]